MEHDHTELVRGCHRCELNVDEMAGEGLCPCAVDLDGLVEQAHPMCKKHYGSPALCPLHGGEWAGYQCVRDHDRTDDMLLAEIIRIWREAAEFSVKAATQIALYGSAFMQITRNPNGPNEVRLLPPDEVVLIQRRQERT